MSEAKERGQALFSFDFNRSVKVRSEAPTITSNAGVLPLREIDHKLSAVETLARELADPRNPERVRYSLTELLRERIYGIALGYSRQDDADMVAHDPAFKTAVWDKAGAQVADERLASQPAASRTIDTLAGWHNREALREGNASAAEGADLFLDDAVDKARELAQTVAFRLIVTNWPGERLCAWELLKHYRQRGTFEDRLGEWNALGVNLSQDSFAKNEVTFLLSLFAFNLLEAPRGEIESAAAPRKEPPAKAEGAGFDMTRLRNIVLKVGGVLTRGGRRLLFDLAEGVAPLWQAVLTRLNKLPPCEQAVSLPQSNSFVPPPSRSFLRFTPRM